MPDLYGKLNKEIQIYNYEGVETDTAKVTVDNKTQDISVDVKRVPNELTLTTINGNTYTYDGSAPASFDIRTQVTDKVEEGNNLPVTSDAVKGYVDSKAGALEYVGGEGNFTNIDGGVTVKGRLNVDDGIYSPVTSADPNFVPNNKSVDDKITASEQKLIDERIGAFTRTADKLFTDVTGGMTIKGHLNVDGGITSASEPTSATDVANKRYVDNSRLYYMDATSVTSAQHDDTGIHVKADATMRTKAGLDYQGKTEMRIPLVGKDGVTIEDDSNNIVAVKADVEAIQKDMAGRFGSNSLWYTTSTGEPSGFGVTDSGQSGDIPVITDGLRLPETIPDENYVAVHKKYVDEALAKKLDTYTGTNYYPSVPTQVRIDSTDPSKGYRQGWLQASPDAIPRTLVQRTNAGTISAKTPTENNNLTTKKYVDDADSRKLDITGGTITGSLAIQGDLTVTGTTTTEKAETLAVKDSVIITNADGAELGATLSGIAIRKDGENTYGVMYDPSSDSVKLGLGTLDAENKFTFNDSGTDGKPIATRDDSGNLTDGDLVRWDGTSKSLVDSGKKVDDFVAKVTKGGGTWAYIIDGNDNQDVLAIDDGASAWALVRRYTDGRARVGTAVEDNDAVNKKQVEDNFVAKLTPPDQFVYAYGYSGNTPVLLKATSSATANQLAYRGTNGVLSVGTPTSDATDAAVNIEYANANYVAKTTATNIAYTTDNNGNPITTHISFNPTAWDLVTFDGKACLRTSNPTGDDGRQCVNKQYADGNYVAKIEPISQTTTAYVVLGDGTPSGIRIDGIAQPNSLAYRSTGGVVRVGTPIGDADATTKAYVDNLNAITITAGA